MQNAASSDIATSFSLTYRKQIRLPSSRFPILSTSTSFNSHPLHLFSSSPPLPPSHLFTITLIIHISTNNSSRAIKWQTQWKHRRSSLNGLVLVTLFLGRHGHNPAPFRLSSSNQLETTRYAQTAQYSQLHPAAVLSQPNTLPSHIQTGLLPTISPRTPTLTA